MSVNSKALSLSIVSKDVEEDLKIALAQQQEAKSLGDFSENSELDIATTKVRELQARKVVLTC